MSCGYPKEIYLVQPLLLLEEICGKAKCSPTLQYKIKTLKHISG